MINANVDLFGEMNTELRQYNSCTLQTKSNATWENSQNSLMQWCYYTLKMEAGECSLFTENFGNKILNILTSGLTNTEKEAELKNEIKMRLLKNEYILDVKFLSFEFTDIVRISIEVETVYTKTTLRLEI